MAVTSSVPEERDPSSLAWLPAPLCAKIEREMAETALYPRVIGRSWTNVAESLRDVHAERTFLRARGDMRIDRGRHPLARAITCVLRLPKSNPAACVQLNVHANGNEEIWRRIFDGRRLDTRQYESPDSHVAERLSLLEFRYRVEPSDGGLLYTQRDVALRLGPLRWRIPAWCAPRVEAREDPAGAGRFTVAVRVVFPGIGPLIAYDGTMVVEERRP